MNVRGVSSGTDVGRRTPSVFALVLVAVVALLISGCGDSKTDTPSSGENQTSSGNTVTDGAIKFTVDPDEVRVMVPSMEGGDAKTKVAPDPGNQFVTVTVKAENTSGADVSLSADDFVLTTTGGKEVKGDAGVQFYVPDGDWYSSIPAGDSAEGIILFEIADDDRVKSISVRGGVDGKGTSVAIG